MWSRPASRQIVKPISRGSFGRVLLARKRSTGDIFAVKVLLKKSLSRKYHMRGVRFERDVMRVARNPFVVRLFFSFTSEDSLYLAMEFLNGGDCYSLLRALGCLEESMARMYIAETVLALEYIHGLGVIHRDLKVRAP